MGVEWGACVVWEGGGEFVLGVLVQHVLMVLRDFVVRLVGSPMPLEVAVIGGLGVAVSVGSCGMVATVGVTLTR